MNSDEYREYCLSRLNLVLNISQTEPLTPDQNSLQSILLLLEKLKKNPTLIAPHIHDLWSAYLYNDGFEYGDFTNIRNTIYSYPTLNF